MLAGYSRNVRIFLQILCLQLGIVCLQLMSSLTSITLAGTSIPFRSLKDKDGYQSRIIGLAHFFSMCSLRPLHPAFPSWDYLIRYTHLNSTHLLTFRTSMLKPGSRRTPCVGSSFPTVPVAVQVDSQDTIWSAVPAVLRANDDSSAQLLCPLGSPQVPQTLHTQHGFVSGSNSFSPQPS